METRVTRVTLLFCTLIFLASIFILPLASASSLNSSNPIFQSTPSSNVPIGSSVNISLRWIGEPQIILFCMNNTCNFCSYDIAFATATNSSCWCADTSFYDNASSCMIPVVNSMAGQTVHVYYHAYNLTDNRSYLGYINSTGTSFSVNTPPVASTVRILPSNATQMNNLSCNYSYYDAQSQQENGTTFQWFKNNSLQTGLTGQTITASNLTVGDTWICQVTAADGINNGTPVNSSAITIIDAYPVVTWTTPNQLFNTTTQTINFTLQDNTALNLSTLSLTINRTTGTSSDLLLSASNVTCSGSNTTKNCYTILNLTDSVYNLTLTIANNAAYTTTAKTNITIDTVPGAIALVENGYHDTGTVYIASTTNIHSLFANWTALQYASSPAAAYEYAVGTGTSYGATGWNDTAGWTDVGLNTNVTVNLTLWSENVYYFYVRARSQAGTLSNVTRSSGILFHDTVPPQCAGGSGPGQGPLCVIRDAAWSNNHNNIHFLLNFTSNASHIISYQFMIGTSPYSGNGTNYSNIRGVTTISSADYTATGLSLSDNVTYYVTARAQGSNQLWSEWFSNDGFKVDTQMPVNGTITYTAINLSANTTSITLYPGIDALSGVAAVQLEYAKTASLSNSTCGAFSSYVLVPGAVMGTILSTTIGQTVLANLDSGYCYRFKYLVSDAAGNTQSYVYNNELQFFVDTTPPQNFSVRLNNNSFYSYTNDFSIAIDPAADPESGIAYYQYTFLDTDGATLVNWTNTSISQTITLPNLRYPNNSSLTNQMGYYAKVMACNRVNLCTTMTSNTVIYLDVTPPAAATILRAGNDTNATDGFIDWSASGTTDIIVTGEAGITCVYSKNDIDYSTMYGTACTALGNNQLNCSIPEGAGAHTYYITCKDSNGNAQSAAQNTQVNWTNGGYAPAITITNPSSNEIVTGTVSLQTSITPTSFPVANAWYTVTPIIGSASIPKTVLIANANGSYTGTISTASLGNNGTYLLTVFANDTYNYTASATTQFTIDNTQPYIELTVPSLVQSNTLPYTIIAQLAENVTATVINSSGGSMGAISNTSNATRNYLNWSGNFDVTTWPDGSYTLIVNATNNHTFNNQTNQSVPVQKNTSFIIDRLAPAYSAVTNLSGTQLFINDTVQLNVTWTDANMPLTVNFEINDSNTTQNLSAGQVLNNSNTYYVILNRSAFSNNKTYYWRSFATDPAGNVNMTLRSTFTITNRAPIDHNASFSFARNNSITLDVSSLFSDPDQDALTYAVLSNGTHITVASLNVLTGAASLIVDNQSWEGWETLQFVATDTFGANTTATANVSIINIPPALNGFIHPQSWLANDSDTINLTYFLIDENHDALNYTLITISDSNMSVNITGGIALLTPAIGWTGTATAQFNAQEIGSHQLNASTNVITLTVLATKTNTTVTDSTIDGMVFNGTTNNITSVDNSAITSSNLTYSSVSNATILRSVIINSQVTGSQVVDSTIDPSWITNSTITGNSTIENSNITNSTLSNVKVTGSVVNDSTFQDTTVTAAEIISDAIFSGTIVGVNGIYNATASGAKNLTAIIDYPPIAAFGTHTLAYAGYSSTLQSAATDRNILANGTSAINDVLTYLWSFGDGTNTSTTSATQISHTYTLAGTYTIQLTVTDAFNRSSVAAQSVTITSAPSGGGGGGIVSTGGAIITVPSTANTTAPIPPVNKTTTTTTPPATPAQTPAAHSPAPSTIPPVKESVTRIPAPSLPMYIYYIGAGFLLLIGILTYVFYGPAKQHAIVLPDPQQIIAQGVTEKKSWSAIRQSLLLAGIPEESATTALYSFVIRQGLAEGQSYPVMRKKLVAKGWDGKKLDDTYQSIAHQ